MRAMNLHVDNNLMYTHLFCALPSEYIQEVRFLQGQTIVTKEEIMARVSRHYNRIAAGWKKTHTDRHWVTRSSPVNLAGGDAVHPRPAVGLEADGAKVKVAVGEERVTKVAVQVRFTAQK